MEGIKVTGKVLRGGQFRASSLSKVGDGNIVTDDWFVITNILKGMEMKQPSNTGFVYTFPIIF